MKSFGEITRRILNKDIKEIKEIEELYNNSIKINGIYFKFEDVAKEFEGAKITTVFLTHCYIGLELDYTNIKEFEITKKQRLALWKFNNKEAVIIEDLAIQEASRLGNIYMMLRDGEATRDIRNILTSLKGYEGSGQKHISKGAQRAIYYLLKAFDIEYKI